VKHGRKRKNSIRLKAYDYRILDQSTVRLSIRPGALARNRGADSFAHD